MIMKTFVKLFSLAFIFAIVFTACSRTRDAAGLDTVYNIVRVGQWESVYKGVGDNITAGVELVPADGHAKFMNNVIQIYDGSGSQASPEIRYSFKDTKTIILDGVEYKIEENMVSTVTTITARADNATKAFYVFKRRR